MKYTYTIIYIYIYICIYIYIYIYINIATMNVITLRTSSKRQELVDLSSIYGISIIGIVDHKLVHDRQIKLENFGEYTIITT